MRYNVDEQGDYVGLEPEDFDEEEKYYNYNIPLDDILPKGMYVGLNPKNPLNYSSNELDRYRHLKQLDHYVSRALNGFTKTTINNIYKESVKKYDKLIDNNVKIVNRYTTLIDCIIESLDEYPIALESTDINVWTDDPDYDPGRGKPYGKRADPDFVPAFLRNRSNWDK